MAKVLKLICESEFSDLEIIEEKENTHSPGILKIKGPYIVTEKRNGNGREYRKDVMEKAVNEFNKNFVMTNRAVGELNHPTTTDIDYNNACHKILKLTQEGNIWVGESQVLIGTPKGDLLAGLLNNGVQVGISTRGVGNINEDKVVDEYKLITTDIVYEPSGPGCFMEGILESKEFMINEHGDIIEVEIAYEKLENDIATLGNKSSDRATRLADALKAFMGQIRV
jgi:hypothetical protein